MNEDITEFLTFCKDEKLKYVKNNTKTARITIQNEETKEIVAKDITYDTYLTFEIIFIMIFSKPFDIRKYSLIIFSPNMNT